MRRFETLAPTTKLAAVAGGYVVAFLIAACAVWIHVSLTSGPDRDASSGMYAFGDSLLFLAVFSVAAVVPTGGALYFLRPYRRFWIALAVAAFVIAATAIAAIVAFLAGRTATPNSVLHMWGAYAVLRLLVAPIFAGGFFGAGLLAPSGGWRPLLFVASAIEAAVFACTVFAWVTSA